MERELEIHVRNSRRSLKVLEFWLLMGLGLVVTSGWMAVASDKGTVRLEPAGTWEKDVLGRTTLNGAPFTGIQTSWWMRKESPLQKMEILVRKWETPFRGGNIDGVVTAWYPNGEKESETPYREGKLEGIRVRWHENGQKASETPFRDGKIDGIQIEWHPNGIKSLEATYLNGASEGGDVRWDINGQIVKPFIKNNLAPGDREELIQKRAQEERKMAEERRALEEERRTLNGQSGRSISKPSSPLNLGAQLQSGSRGLTVTGIAPETPAAWAGLQVGDKLVNLEGQPVPKTVAAFLAQLDTYAEKSILKLEIERAGHSQAIRLPWIRKDAPVKEGGHEGD